MLKVFSNLVECVRRAEGQAMVEYGLIVGLISVIAIVALTAIGTDLNGIYTAVQTTLAAVPGA